MRDHAKLQAAQQRGLDRIREIRAQADTARASSERAVAEAEAAVATRFGTQLRTAPPRLNAGAAAAEASAAAGSAAGTGTPGDAGGEAPAARRSIEASRARAAAGHQDPIVAPISAPDSTAFAGLSQTGKPYLPFDKAAAFTRSLGLVRVQTPP